jgi:hypothetical protein
MAATSKGCTNGPRVLKVLTRGRVIIDARDLRRVMDRKTGEVFAECEPQRDAEVYAETMNEIAGNDHVIVVPYAAPKSCKRAAVS